MSDFEQFAVHKSADSLSVHKARMARPRFAHDTPAEDEDDELEMQDDQPDSPAPDTEVQARVDSIALAQKRLSAKSSEKSRFDSNKAPKSRFGQVKEPEEADEPASDEKKIKVASGTAGLHSEPPIHSAVDGHAITGDHHVPNVYCHATSNNYLLVQSCVGKLPGRVEQDAHTDTHSH